MVPLPFLHITLLFVGVIPCRLGVIPLFTRLHLTLIYLLYSLVYANISFVPRCNHHFWQSLSFVGTIARVLGTFLFPGAAILWALPRFALFVHPSRFSHTIPLFVGWLLGGEVDYLVLDVFWRCWCFLSVGFWERCWIFFICLQCLLFWEELSATPLPSICNILGWHFPFVLWCNLHIWKSSHSLACAINFPPLTCFLLLVIPCDYFTRSLLVGWLLGGEVIVFCLVYFDSVAAFFLLAVPLLGTVSDAGFFNCLRCFCFVDVLFVVMFAEWLGQAEILEF